MSMQVADLFCLFSIAEGAIAGLKISCRLCTSGQVDQALNCFAEL